MECPRTAAPSEFSLVRTARIVSPSSNKDEAEDLSPVERATFRTLLHAELLQRSGLRKRLNLSRAVFAQAIRTNPRTVESWEQGRSKPNTHAPLLIKLVAKYPETLDQLQTV